MSNRIWNVWRLIVRFFTRDPGLRDAPPAGLACEMCNAHTGDPMFYRGKLRCDDCYFDTVELWREECAD